ncbi:ABC-F family ATP-binding cassette domain-containing protein [Patescibacteria group bacterium]|nr:ABC-F family ATP-binding cassette domain-containing protein [Patescibacteria group bacterium]
MDEQWQTYRIAEVLEEVGLTSLDPKSLLQTLSGGQQRRILFARLLLQEADILLLDEPTNHIDVATKEWLVQYIKVFP